MKKSYVKAAIKACFLFSGGFFAFYLAMVRFDSLAAGVIAGVLFLATGFTLIFLVLLPVFGRIFFDNLATPKMQGQLKSMGLFRFMLNLKSKDEESSNG